MVDSELRRNLQSACEFAAHGHSAEEFADSLGLQRGVSGFINHTVPVAIFCWLRHRDDFRAAVEAAVCLGGDTDTVGAIVGGLVGARQGGCRSPAKGLEPPDSWMDGLMFARPLSSFVLWLSLLRSNLEWAVRLSLQLEEVVQSGQPQIPVCRSHFKVLIRNAIFAVVLGHGFRRLLPPY